MITNVMQMHNSIQFRSTKLNMMFDITHHDDISGNLKWSLLISKINVKLYKDYSCEVLGILDRNSINFKYDSTLDAFLIRILNLCDQTVIILVLSYNLGGLVITEDDKSLRFTIK